MCVKCVYLKCKQTTSEETMKNEIITFCDHAIAAYERKHGVKVTTEEQMKMAIAEGIKTLVPELANV